MQRVIVSVLLLLPDDTFLRLQSFPYNAAHVFHIVFRSL